MRASALYVPDVGSILLPKKIQYSYRSPKDVKVGIQSFLLGASTKGQRAEKAGKFAYCALGQGT